VIILTASAGKSDSGLLADRLRGNPAQFEFDQDASNREQVSLLTNEDEDARAMRSYSSQIAS